MGNKYRAKKTIINGIRFDSKKEANRWCDLQIMQQAGEISNLERQVPIYLLGRDENILTPTGRKMRYVADFQYFDHRINAVVLEDSKGFPTEVFKLKKAILAAMGVDVKIT